MNNSRGNVPAPLPRAGDPCEACRAATAAGLPLPAHKVDASKCASNSQPKAVPGDGKENAPVAPAPAPLLKRTRNQYEDDDTYATVEIDYFNCKDVMRARKNAAKMRAAKSQPPVDQPAPTEQPVPDKEPENVDETTKGKGRAQGPPNAAPEKAKEEERAIVFEPIEPPRDVMRMYNRHYIPFFC